MDTKIKVSTEIWPWRKIFCCRSCRDSNPWPFTHETSALTRDSNPWPFTHETSALTRDSNPWPFNHETSALTRDSNPWPFNHETGTLTRDSNPWPFNHETSALTSELPLLPRSNHPFCHCQHPIAMQLDQKLVRDVGGQSAQCRILCSQLKRCGSYSIQKRDGHTENYVRLASRNGQAGQKTSSGQTTTTTKTIQTER